MKEASHTKVNAMIPLMKGTERSQSHKRQKGGLWLPGTGGAGGGRREVRRMELQIC